MDTNGKIVVIGSTSQAFILKNLDFCEVYEMQDKAKITNLIIRNDTSRRIFP